MKRRDALRAVFGTGIFVATNQALPKEVVVEKEVEVKPPKIEVMVSCLFSGDTSTMWSPGDGDGE